MWTLTAPDGRQWTADSYLKAASAAQRDIVGPVKMAENLQAALREEAVAMEDEIERAFWEFDARHKGYDKWKGCPQSVRDAFKWAARELLSGVFAKDGS